MIMFHGYVSLPEGTCASKVRFFALKLRCQKHWLPSASPDFVDAIKTAAKSVTNFGCWCGMIEIQGKKEREVSFYSSISYTEI